MYKPNYEVGLNKPNRVRSDYKMKVGITTFFVTLAFIFNGPIRIGFIESDYFAGYTLGTILWLALGGYMYSLDFGLSWDKSKKGDRLLTYPIAITLLLWIIYPHLVDLGGPFEYIFIGESRWFLRNIFYFVCAIFSFYSFITAPDTYKYDIMYVPTYYDVLHKTTTWYGELSQEYRRWFESRRMFEPEYHEEAIQAFFARKESQKEFDEDLVTDKALELWLSLDGQHDYYNGLQEKLEAKFYDFMDKAPKHANILIKQVDAYQSFEKRLYENGFEDIFDREAPGTDEENKTLVTEIHNLRCKEYELTRDKFSFWLEQIHHNLYPANRFFENLLEKKFVENAFNGIDRGVRGEQLLMNELSLFDDRFKILENVNIREDNMNAESDAIVISQYGVFTIEAKNFAEDGGYSVHISKDGRWLRKLSNGQFEPMNDVIQQSNRHILIKQKMLNREMKKMGLLDKNEFIDIYGAIVVTNNVVDIDNQSDYPIMRLSSLYDHVRNKNTQPIYTEEQVQAMVDLFKKHQQPDVKFPIRDVEREFDIQLAFLNDRLKEYDIYREHLKYNQ